METHNTPSYDNCDGFTIPPAFSPDAFRSSINYQHQPGQLFIAAYPKTGSTWLQHIVMLILRKGQPIEDEMDFLMNAPMLEMAGAEAVSKINGPGIIKIHLPFSMVRTSPKAKYICLARNPRDCCVSFYHHTKNIAFYNFQNGTFEEYFDLFINGRNDYGDYFDQLLSWYEHKDDPNVHFITYESLKKDTKGEVLKLARFIGEDYYSGMMTDPKYLENVLYYSSLGYMKKKVNEDMGNLIGQTNKPIEQSMLTPGHRYFLETKSKHVLKNDESDYKFIRKGIVGDWKNHFTPEQEERMQRWIERRTKGSDVMNLWKYI